MSTTSRKDTLRGLAHAAVAALVVLCVLVGLSLVLAPKDNDEASGMYEARANGVLGEPAGSIDVIFLGDSEAYSSFSPIQMWGEQGFTSYVCASRAQRLYYANTLLHRATSNQAPRVVVIETNMLFRKFSVSSALMRFAMDALPALEYHDRWKSLTPADFTSAVSYTHTDPYKGYVLRRSSKPATGREAGERNELAQAHVPRVNEWYLRSMVGYCRSIGAEPLLVSTPSTVNWNEGRHAAVAELADELGVTYLDLNEDEEGVGIDWSTDTRDRGDHMNLSGAKKVSTYVGAFLATTYDLPNHRDDDAYAAWDESLEWYEQEVG